MNLIHDISTPFKKFFLVVKQETTIFGLITTGINHIKEAPTPNILDREPNKGTKTRYPPTKKIKDIINIFSHTGITINSGLGNKPLKKYPPIIEGKINTLGPNKRTLLTSLSALNDSRALTTSIMNKLNRIE